MNLQTAREIISLFDSREHAIAEVNAARHAGHSDILLKVCHGVGFISTTRVEEALKIYNLAN